MIRAELRMFRYENERGKLVRNSQDSARGALLSIRNAAQQNTIRVIHFSIIKIFRCISEAAKVFGKTTKRPDIMMKEKKKDYSCRN